MRSQETAATIAGDWRSAEGGAEPVDRRLLIDGRLVIADRTFASVNPATGAVLGYAPDAGVAEAEAAIAAARRAFDTTTWPTDANCGSAVSISCIRRCVEHARSCVS